MPQIVSLDDPRLDPYRQLRQTNLTRWSGLFIAEGRLVVERLLDSVYPVESILISERRAAALLPALPDDAPVLVIPQDLAEELVGYNFHAGVLACGRRLGPFTVDEALAVCRKSFTVVACPRITNPDNLGAIVRNSAALGADAVLLGPGSCDPFSRRALRVSMGTALRLPIVESQSLLADLVAARDAEGWQLIAATVAAEGAEVLAEVQRPTRVILVLGNEAEGLSDEWHAACDRHVSIPMASGVDSLNVAVAGGILLHHLLWMAPVVPWPAKPAGGGLPAGETF